MSDNGIGFGWHGAAERLQPKFIAESSSSAGVNERANALESWLDIKVVQAVLAGNSHLEFWR